MVLGLSTNFEI